MGMLYCRNDTSAFGMLYCPKIPTTRNSPLMLEINKVEKVTGLPFDSLSEKCFNLDLASSVWSPLSEMRATEGLVAIIIQCEGELKCEKAVQKRRAEEEKKRLVYRQAVQVRAGCWRIPHGKSCVGMRRLPSPDSLSFLQSLLHGFVEMK